MGSGVAVVVTIDVDGDPQPQGSKKAFVVKGPGGKPRAVIVDDNKTVLKTWRGLVTGAARLAAQSFDADAPLRLDVVYRLRRPKTARRIWPTVRPDLDKLARSVGDALTDAATYRDDAQICVSHQKKRYALPHERPGALICVSLIEGDPMTTNCQLSGRLPGNETNGLEPYYERFLDQHGTGEPVIGIVQIERKKWAHDDVTGEPSSIIRITRIECAEGDDRDELLDMLKRLTAERTGDTQLELGLDEDEEA